MVCGRARSSLVVGGLVASGVLVKSHTQSVQTVADNVTSELLLYFQWYVANHDHHPALEEVYDLVRSYLF